MDNRVCLGLVRWVLDDEHGIWALEDGEGGSWRRDHPPWWRMVSGVAADSDPPCLRESVDDDSKVLDFQRR